jgi:hypothetical protein
MSIQQLLATTQACLADDGVGLAVRVDALASTAAIPPEKIRTDFAFVAWKLAGTLQSSRTPNIMLRPVRWSPVVKQQNHRDAPALVEIAGEWFDADPIVLQENIALAAAALAQTLDGLRDYSDAHQGTVIDVLDPMDFRFGDFPGGASAGFTATIQILERSSQ